MSSEKKSIIPKFTELNELAGLMNGGQVIFATDDWFASAESMLQNTEPVFIADKYTEFGKWMDGWETRRKRIPGHDWCIVKLGAPCNIKGILVDTAFFTGNYAPRISIQGASLSEYEESLLPHRQGKMGTACSADELQMISKLKTECWPELVEMTSLKPGYEETRKTYISVDSNEVCTYIRVNIYPDGGIARLRVFGTVVPDLSQFDCNDVIDLIAMENGGTCVGYSNAHFGHPRNLIKPNRGVNMGDGWETMRRLDRPAILEADSNGILKVPGCEWAIIKMCCLGYVSEIVVDTCHFKGNFPDSVKIEGTILSPEETLSSAKWVTILANQKLSANKEHFYKNEIHVDGPFSHVRITMSPDGGISRVRLFGQKAH
ncbi:Allantoicase [Pseudolycoriella hygida]|uniref:Allantoate amidinohydrolase n=1 Tax=Pseudolycoriella hygida TaxID=35572 RepID=A0A9Q0NFL4_9DIPT|nr:Allantoicase [Pseudolycoriella hygida]